MKYSCVGTKSSQAIWENVSMGLTRIVSVNGIQVELFDDTQPSPNGLSPMRVTLGFMRDSPYFRPDLPADVKAEAIADLRASGVKSLPLYKSEAEKAGIKWDEVD